MVLPRIVAYLLVIPMLKLLPLFLESRLLGELLPLNIPPSCTDLSGVTPDRWVSFLGLVAFELLRIWVLTISSMERPFILSRYSFTLSSWLRWSKSFSGTNGLRRFLHVCGKSIDFVKRFRLVRIETEPGWSGKVSPLVLFRLLVSKGDYNSLGKFLFLMYLL